MNKKLKPWFIGSIVCAAMLAAALIILGFDGSFTDMKISTMMRVGFPAAWAMFFSVWSSCGFVGTAIELRTGRRAVLPVFLGIMPLLLAAQTVWAHLDYSPGGMLNFSGLALALRLIMYTAPGIIMLIADVALIITRLRKKPSPPEAAGEAVCFTKLRALYIILFVVFALPPFAFVAGCVGAQEAALIGAKHEQRRTAELAVEYYKAADDMIDYCNDMYLDDTIFGLPLRRPTALIDYDEMRVTFLIRTYKDEMLSYRLERVSEEPPGLVHFVCPLEGAGREFRLYIFDEGSGSRVRVTVEMNDGSLWYADMNGERPLISSSPCPDIAEALRLSDVLVEYGNNNAENGTQFPRYSMGITRNTFGLDRSAKTGYVIYCRPDYSWEREGYAPPCGNIYVRKLEFEPFDENDLIYIEPVAKIPLDKPGEYIMPYYKSGGGILLYTADGIYDAYMSSPWDTGFDDCAYSLKNRSSRELAG